MSSLDIIVCERALTAFWAAELGLEVDKTIFRGCLPAGDGVAVRIVSELTGEGPEIRKFNVQIIGRGDRDVCLSRLAACGDALPRYGAVANGLTIRAMLRRGSGGSFPATDQGRVREQFSFNLVATFC